MREIIHIQAGSLSNYTGTHFWNTQESYFVFDEDSNVSITDHDISFKEGRDEHNRPTLCPRLLAFDQKSNFGILTRNSHREEAQTWPTIWHGSLVRLEQEQIPRSEYHSHLDLEGDGEQAEPLAMKIRYWSDFSRVFFDPKSIQAVPDAPEIVQGDWNASCEAFSRYDDNTELMDGSLRLLVEDCDNFQGVQMIQDTSIFGGFSNSLLSAFREEHPKATIISFACLSSISPVDANLGDSSQTKQVLNDVLSLRSVAEVCNLSIPILSPSSWQKDCWFPGYIDNESLYQSSAILSAHIETVTLPLRLRGGLDDLQTIVAQLNWRKSSPFAVLRGTMCPQGLSTEKLQDIASLSMYSDGRVPFAQRDVSRGFSEDEMVTYNAWSKAHELKGPFLSWHHLPSYPIPTSFPPIFPNSRPKALEMLSSLSTCASTGGQLSNYARFVENAGKRRDSTFLAIGLEGDEMKDLVNALWDIIDGYGDSENGGGDLSEGMGEDEQ